MSAAADPSWKSPPEFIDLLPDEVHVWRAALSVSPSQIKALAPILAADERERADRFHFEKDRGAFIAGRALLRILLGRYLHKEPSQLEFHYGASGKPRLAGEESALHFNLSHSHSLALYAFSRGRELGIDVEHIKCNADAEKIAERFFSAQEVAVFRSLPASDREKAFFDCWTRKEAYVKAKGNGLKAPLDAFSVSLSPGEPAALLNVRDDAAEASRWSLRELEPGPGYAGTIIAEGNEWRLKCWEWKWQTDSKAQSF
jgi:4'-phosphopantetheinyl transferase